jgi:hypothetical protein
MAYLNNADRLWALALEEDRDLERQAPPTNAASTTQLSRLESKARSLFLLEVHDPSEVRGVLSSFVQGWRALVGSDDLVAAGSYTRALASEHLMDVWGLAMAGLWTAVALDDREAVAWARPRLAAHWPDQNELAEDCACLAAQICALYQGDRSAPLRFWPLDDEDDLQVALRAIAASDEPAVRRALATRSEQRAVALNHAIDGRSLLRAVPARLAMETEAVALIRIARVEGLAIASDAVTPRARDVWQLR